MICVIDYGMGNLRSVSKAIEKLGGPVKVSSEPKDIECADKLILPGVGAFGDGCKELQKRKLFEPLRRVLTNEKPFFGICLGLQLLFETSEESPGAKGLGVFAGKVQKFRTSDLKVPHIGWNEMTIKEPRPQILRGLPERDYFYFVHSFYPVPQDPSIVAGVCEYGETFPVFITKGAISASQFHPEKSQTAGLKILQNFIEL